MCYRPCLSDVQVAGAALQHMYDVEGPWQSNHPPWTLTCMSNIGTMLATGGGRAIFVVVLVVVAHAVLCGIDEAWSTRMTRQTCRCHLGRHAPVGRVNQQSNASPREICTPAMRWPLRAPAALSLSKAWSCCTPFPALAWLLANHSARLFWAFNSTAIMPYFGGLCEINTVVQHTPHQTAYLHREPALRALHGAVVVYRILMMYFVCGPAFERHGVFPTLRTPALHSQHTAMAVAASLLLLLASSMLTALSHLSAGCWMTKSHGDFAELPQTSVLLHVVQTLSSFFAGFSCRLCGDIKDLAVVGAADVRDP